MLLRDNFYLLKVIWNNCLSFLSRASVRELFECPSYVGLYRDDGLAYFPNITGRQADVIRKDFHERFSRFGLNLEIQCNLKVVNFLDVTLNLNDGSYKPFRKQEQETIYINTRSNHPKSIIEQLPMTVEKRIGELSSNQAIFNEAAKYYQNVLDKNGYKHTLKYRSSDEQNPNSTKRRSRKIIWFNPPYNKNVATNVGKYFLMLVDKHFKRNHRLRKIFNRSTLKISYSCMPNFKSLINAHNEKVMKSGKVETKNASKECNCRSKENCPMKGKCLATNIVYEAAISDEETNGQGQRKVYYGICETTFKVRYANHKKSFNHARYRNETELSREFWKIKESGGKPTIEWTIKKFCRQLNPNSRRCNLCLSEKYFILVHHGQNLLNKRSELVSKCRHQNKFSLTKV